MSDWTWVLVWIVWALLVAASFAVLEYLSLKRSDDLRPPLTQVIQRYIPAWLIAIVLGAFAFWGFEHFIE